MKNRIKTLILAVVIAISLLFAVSPVVNAGVSSYNHSYGQNYNNPNYTYVRVLVGDVWYIYVYDGPGLVEVIIEGDD